MVRQFESNHTIDLLIVDSDVVRKSCFHRLVCLALCGKMPMTIVLTSDEAQQARWRVTLPSVMCIGKNSSITDFANAVLGATEKFHHR